MFSVKQLTPSVHEASSSLTFKNHFDRIKFRLGFNRDKFRVAPGLYRLGAPTKNSHIFVTGNLSITFDSLRASLDGMNAWILVLDTKGVNVWCAAGKGTFGTEELIHRIKECGLEHILAHRNLILPQLGAPGIKNYVVKQETGFRIIYGPVYAKDIKAFLELKLKKTDEMKRINFSLLERLELTPIELMTSSKWLLGVILLYLIVTSATPYSRLFIEGIVGAWISGNLLFVAALPFIPFTYFSIGGFLISIPVTLIVSQELPPLLLFTSLLVNASFSAYWALNFTGSTTFTSPSGVEKEMSLFLRPIAILFAVSLLMTLILSYFVEVPCCSI